MSFTTYFLIQDLANLAYNNMWKYDAQEILVNLVLIVLGIVFCAVLLVSLTMSILNLIRYFKLRRIRKNEEVEMGQMRRWNEEHRRQSRRRIFEPNNNLPTVHTRGQPARV